MVFSTHAANEIDEYGLFLSPNLCLLSKKETRCDINIQVRWQTPQRSDYCLYKNISLPAIHCWQDSAQANIKVEFTLEENLTLLLVDTRNGKTVYQQLVRLQKQAKKYRRSRRNPWRFY